MQVFQAPMDGYSDYALREVLATKSSYRPDRFFTEFVNVEAIVRNIPSVRRILSFSEGQRPISAQLFGKNPESFFKATLYCVSLGFDGIDINMGCPAKNVAGKNEGAGLIKNMKLAGEIIDSCKKAIAKSKRKNISLSVKTRLGYENDIGEDWIGFLDRQYLDFITIHGRTFAQAFKGESNWDRIGELAKASKTPIIGNGDIESLENAREMQEKYGLYATMIGRNMTCFFDNKIEALKEYLQVHSENVSKHYSSEKIAINSSKKVQLLFLKGLPDTKVLRKDLLDSENYDISLKLIANHDYEG